MENIILVTSKYLSARNICIFFIFIFIFFKYQYCLQLIKQYLNSKFQTELFVNCKVFLIKADIEV